MNGWNADFTWHLRNRLRDKLNLVADFGAGYKGVPANVHGIGDVTVKVRYYPLVFGPRVIITHNGKVTPFAEALFGFTHASAGVSGIGSESANKFAMAFGGGFDVDITQRIALRLGRGDYLIVRNGVNLNNLRVSSGVIIKF